MLIIKAPRKKHIPCKDCSFKLTKKCKKVAKCVEYLPITPSCTNCMDVKRCSTANLVAFCKRWDPDRDSPFVALMMEIANIESSFKGVDAKTLNMLDDSDFTLAPNWLTCCLDHLAVEPYPRQIQEASDFFNDICLAGNSRVVTEYGLLNLEELYQDLIPGTKEIQSIKVPLEVPCKNPLGYSTRFGLTRIVDETQYILLDNGISQIGTKDHRIKVLDEKFNTIWKRMEDLKENDLVVMKYGSNLWPTKQVCFKPFHCKQNSRGRLLVKCCFPKILDPLFARFIGYLTGDGHLSDHTIKFYNDDKLVIKDFVKCITILFPGASYRVADYIKHSKRRFYVECSIKNVREFLYKNVWPNGPELSGTKYVPKVIRMSPKPVVIEFLRGYFEADGNYGHYVRVSSKSRRLLKDIQLLLVNMGIYSTIKKEIIYTLRIWPAIHLELTPLSKRKKKMLTSVEKFFKTSLHCIKGSKKIINDLIKPYKNNLLGAYIGGRRYDVNIRSDISIKNIHNYTTQIDNVGKFFPDVIQNLYDRLNDIKNGYLFIPLKKKKLIKKKIPVYDFTVPAVNSFISNGIVNHNCYDCSNPAYRSLYDQSLGNILDNVVFLEYGVCPKCKKNRDELISEYDDMYWYNELCGIAGQRSGKCLVKGSLLPTSKGLVPIEKLSSKNHKINSWEDIDIDVLSRKGKTKAVRLYKGEEKTLNIVTKHGFELGGRYEHPILILDKDLSFKWKTLEQINIGDKVCIERNKGMHSQSSAVLTNFEFTIKNSGIIPEVYTLPKRVNSDFALFLGYMVAEGGLNSFTNKDREILKDFIKCFKNCFPNKKLKYNDSKLSEEDIWNADIAVTVQFHSKQIKEFLTFCGLRKGSGNKIIPWCILQSKKQHVTSFLKAYFEGDGYVSKKGGVVSTTTKSKKLAKQIQIVLLNLGIVSYTKSIRKAATNGTNIKKTYWSIKIIREDIPKFYKEVGFISKRKQKRLRVFSNEPKYMYNDRVPFLTEGLSEFRNNYMEEACGKYKINNKFVSIPTKIRCSTYNQPQTVRNKKNEGSSYKVIKRKFKYPVLRKIKQLDKKLANKLYTVIKYSYFISEITSVTPGGKEIVYDLEVPYTHSFIGNGFVNHNSELCGMMSAYIWEWYTKLSGNPSKFFGLTGSTKLHMNFVALTFGQAKDTLWDPFSSYIRESWWFKEYHAFLHEKCNELGIDQVLKFEETFILYKHKNLQAAPLGPDKRILRGRTRIFYCLAGNTLVDTDEGLIPITESELVGKNTGHLLNDSPIINWGSAGNKKRFDVNLDFGYSISGSKDHQILVFGKEKMCLKKIGDVSLNDYVGLALGSSFPTRDLEFNYENKSKLTYKQSILEQMYSKKTFVKDDIETSVHHNTFWRLTSKLLKGKFLKKIYRKGIDPSTTDVRAEYRITKKFTMKKVLKFTLGNQKIARHRANITIPTRMTKSLAYLIGYYVSEGSYAGISHEFTFSNTDRRVVDHFNQCFKDCFNIYPKEIISNITVTGKICWSSRIAYKEIKDFLHFIGLKEGSIASDKEVPWSILRSNRKHVLCFLKTLFEGDGCGSQEYAIFLTSASSTLLKHTQQLLLKIGIVSKYIEPKQSQVGKLYMNIFDSIKFYETVGSVTYDRYVDRAVWKQKNYFRQYKIPNTKYFVLDTLNKNVPEKYKKFVNNKIIWLQVKSIIDTGIIEEMFDIAVDSKSHLFRANGIITHNSIDEFGWFTGTEKAIKLNPDEVYKALSNSLKTIRVASERIRKRTKYFHLPTGYAINISSPMSARDGIMRLLYKSRKIKTIHAFHYPTWEMNPTYVKSDFDDDYLKNPVTARRDFGAFPPLADSPFIAEAGPLIELQDKTRENMVKYVLQMVQSGNGNKYVSAMIKKIKPCGRPLMMGLDAGFSNNAFAIVLCSYTHDGEVILEGVIEVKPLPGMPVNFPHVYKKVIKPILDSQTVIAVVIDRWQSIDLVQRIEEDYEGEIDAFRYSLKYGDFEMVRSRLLGEQVRLPVPEVKTWDAIIKGVEDYEEYFIGRPISHFFLQLVTVQDSGRRVEKSGDLDDDIFRAFSLCVRWIFDEEYKYSMLTFDNSEEYSVGCLGVAHGRTMGKLGHTSKAVSAGIKTANSMGISVGRSSTGTGISPSGMSDIMTKYRR
jgi:intein/homing endonuclease